MDDMAERAATSGSVKSGASASRDDRLKHDLSCARCGYNLRGLHVSGVCPECGETVETSLKGNLLRHADSHWLRTVTRGMAWTTWSLRIVIIGFGLIILTMFSVGIVLEIMLEADRAAKLGYQIVEGMTYVWMLTPFGIGIGLWMLMAIEPREDIEAGMVPIIARLLAAMVVPAFGLWAMMVLPRMGMNWPQTVEIATANALFVIVVFQVWTMRGRLASFNSRVENLPRWGYLRKTSFTSVIILPAIFLLLYWVGPLRWQGVAQPGWVLPTIDSHRMLLFGTGLFWLTAIRMASQYRRAVRHEFVQARMIAQSEMKMGPHPPGTIGKGALHEH
jgi:hypothetical protein